MSEHCTILWENCNVCGYISLRSSFVGKAQEQGGVSPPVRLNQHAQNQEANATPHVRKTSLS